MGKIYVIRLISLLTLLVCLPASAQVDSFESGGIQYRILDRESVMVTWQWFEGDIEIPSKVTYNGKTYNVDLGKILFVKGIENFGEFLINKFLK